MGNRVQLEMAYHPEHLDWVWSLYLDGDLITQGYSSKGIGMMDRSYNDVVAHIVKMLSRVAMDGGCYFSIHRRHRADNHFWSLKRDYYGMMGKEDNILHQVPNLHYKKEFHSYDELFNDVDRFREAALVFTEYFEETNKSLIVDMGEQKDD